MAGQTFLGLGFEAYRQKSRTLGLKPRTLVSKRGTPAVSKIQVMNPSQITKNAKLDFNKIWHFAKVSNPGFKMSRPSPGTQKKHVGIMCKSPEPWFRNTEAQPRRSKKFVFFFIRPTWKSPEPWFQNAEAQPGKNPSGPKPTGKKTNREKCSSSSPYI